MSSTSFIKRVILTLIAASTFLLLTMRTGIRIAKTELLVHEEIGHQIMALCSQMKEWEGNWMYNPRPGELMQLLYLLQVNHIDYTLESLLESYWE